MKKEKAQKILNKTKNDYNRIANDFSNKRNYLPPDIIALEEYLESGDKVLDFGCGNGRFSELAKKKEAGYVGVDISSKMIEAAQQRYPKEEFLVVDPFSLPFPSRTFDKVFCLAVLHHLPGKEMRLRFLQEAYRVLRPGGKLVLTVWYLWNKPEMMREIVKYGVFSLMGIESLDFGDVLIPFKDAEGEVMVKRYLHCFTKKELQVTVKEAGFEVVHQEVQSRGTRKVNENLLIIAKR